MTNLTTKKAAISSTVDSDKQAVIFDFEHGKQILINVSQLSEEIKTHAMLHGLKQKLGDAAAIARDTLTGKPATIETKFQAMQEVLDRLLGGEWNKTREGGGQEGGMLLQALISLYPQKSSEQLKAFLLPLTNGEKAALRLDPAIAKALLKIQASRVSKEVDVKGLLSGLGDPKKELTKPKPMK